MSAKTFDPIWEEKYKAGHMQRAPWDEAVSFIFRNKPQNRDHSDIKIMEVGCGTASNLWFAALQGFQVFGVDGSAAAIETAKKRFAEEELSGDLRVGDFTQLPFDAVNFDLVIDRGALTCCGTSSMQQALKQIYDGLKIGGRLLFTPYADIHSSALSGRLGEDGLIHDITKGTLIGAGQIRFLSREEIFEFLPKSQWTILSMDLVEVKQMLEPEGITSAHWRVVAEKT